MLSEFKELNKKIQDQKKEIDKRIDRLRDPEDFALSLQNLNDMLKLEAWKEFAKIPKSESNLHINLPESEFSPDAKKLLTSPNLTPPNVPVPITPPLPKLLPKFPIQPLNGMNQNKKIYISIWKIQLNSQGIIIVH